MTNSNDKLHRTQGQQTVGVSEFRSITATSTLEDNISKYKDTQRANTLDVGADSHADTATDMSVDSGELLDHAAALVSSRSGTRPSLRHAYTSSMTSSISSMSSMHHTQQNNDRLQNPDTLERDMGAGLSFGSSKLLLSAADPTIVTTSLFDPHPTLIPPSGSRFAFAGAASRKMTNLLRPLPSLEDILLRQASPPLCLHSYCQYLAGVEGRAEEIEFWLALVDYEELCGRYAATLPPAPLSLYYPRDSKAGAQKKAPFLSLATSSTQHVSVNGTGTSSTTAQPHGETRPLSLVEISARIMTESASGGKGMNRPQTATSRISIGIENLDKETQDLDNYLASLSLAISHPLRPSKCESHYHCANRYTPFTEERSEPRPPRQDSRGVREFFARAFSGDAQQHSTPLLEKPQASTTPQHVSADDVRRSAERLYYEYVALGGQSEIALGTQMRNEIGIRIERDARVDPDVFSPVKRHVFETLQSESYPRFLRERMFHNITRGTAAPRIAFGLALVFCALVIQLSLILLDVRPKAWRWLPLIALWPGFAFAIAGVVRLDPLMAVMGSYESVAWRMERVVDANVRDRHLKRASMVVGGSAIVAFLISLVLWLVPGHHL